MIPVVSPAGPLVIAHRGGAEETVENSYASLQYARDLGVRHYETDVHLTADGEVVLSHDESLERCYGEEGTVGDYTYKELLEFTNDAGEPMPLLAEALQMFPDLYFNIDAKTDQVVDPLLATLEAEDAFGRVLLSSFSERRLEKVRDMDIPDLSTSLGVRGVVQLLFASETVSSADTWRVPGPRQHVRAAQVPEKSRGVRVVSRRFVATAHTAGLAVHVWTVNDPERMVRLFDWGVDGVVTDVPSVAKQILIERGQWSDTDG